MAADQSAVAVADFLEETKLTKKPKTLRRLFHVADLLHGVLREGLPRRHRARGHAAIRGLPSGGERAIAAHLLEQVRERDVVPEVARRARSREENYWPRFTEEEPEVYEREDLAALFAACDTDERLWFEFFLMTGMREQEVMHLTGRHEPAREYGESLTSRTGVDAESVQGARDPDPCEAHRAVKAWKPRENGTCGLGFPTASGNPKLDFLDCLKVVAARAELDEDEFWLHKFRATFATWSCGPASICAPCSSGWATQTWSPRCAI